jgi:hypothetical protein
MALYIIQIPRQIVTDWFSSGIGSWGLQRYARPCCCCYSYLHSPVAARRAVRYEIASPYTALDYGNTLQVCSNEYIVERHLTSTSSKETTKVALQTLLSLVSSPGGAKILAELGLDDWSPLIEIAPEQPYVLQIFIWAWSKGAQLMDKDSKAALRLKVDKAIQSLIASFKGTDATSLLDFISHLAELDPDVSVSLAEPNSTAH